MKKYAILLVAITVAGAVSTQAQSLKELLYSGKLKSDTGSVVRKTDDLSAKIDTSTRQAAPPPVQFTATPTVIAIDSVTGQPVLAPGEVVITDSTSAEAGPAVPRDNDAIWKDYTEELTTEIRREVLPNRRIKEGTYSVLIVYEIDTDGQININTVSASPSSPYLEEQVKNRMILTAPRLTPLLNQFGKPRKAVKRQTIVLTKG